MIRWFLVVLTLSTSVSNGQETPEGADDIRARKLERLEAVAEGLREHGTPKQIVEHWRAMTDLPAAAKATREAGYSADEVAVALEAARSGGLDAAAARGVLRGTVRSAKAGRRVDGLGSQVRALVADGKRGRDLAAAVRALHGGEEAGKGRRRGKGKGKAAGGRGKGAGKAHGKGKGPRAGSEGPRPEGQAGQRRKRGAEDEQIRNTRFQGKKSRVLRSGADHGKGAAGKGGDE